MTTARREYFLLIVGLILLVVTGGAVYYMQHSPNRSRDMAQISTIVESFGNYEKNVFLEEKEDLLKMDIQQGYGPYVTESLLNQWRAEPATAPGRLTSSPWPERIEIDSITPQGQGYIVSGRVVMGTSTGESGQVPVVLFMMRDEGKWKIGTYQEQKAPEATAAK